MPLPPLPCLHCPPDGTPCTRCGDDPGPAVAETAPAQPGIVRLPKAAVAYRPSADPAVRCGTCVMFHDGRCDLVKGRISPDSVCDRWEPRAGQGSRPTGDTETHLAGRLIAELAIDLGNLTGVWADVYARQEALYAKHGRKARTAWRKALAGLDVAALVAAFRRQVLMLDGAPAPGTDHESPEAAKHHRRELRALARSMASGFLAGLNDQPDWSGLLAAVTAGLLAASGEGTAAALAVSAAAAGYDGFAWDKAAKDGRAAPDQGTVTGWAARIIAGAVTDLAKALAAGAIAGATADVMAASASAVLRKSGSVTAYLDQAMASAVSAATSAAYAALGGIELLAWATAGDGRVCPTCQGYEDDGPYSPRDYPATPHPRCRCTPVPAGGLTLPLGAFAAYLIKRAA